MKKIFFIVILILIISLSTSCSDNEYDTITKLNKDIKVEKQYTQLPTEKTTTEEMILTYLEGAWVEYSYGDIINFMVESVDNIYIAYEYFDTKQDFINAIKNGKCSNYEITITEQGFEIYTDVLGGWVDKYTFDFSNIKNIDEIILCKDTYIDGEYFTSRYYVRPGKEYTEPKLEEPQIGMTYEEVKSSTWGSPDDINKTTYEWGTTEQWCYSGYKYIYFENGVVTAIQE